MGGSNSKDKSTKKKSKLSVSGIRNSFRRKKKDKTVQEEDKIESINDQEKTVENGTNGNVVAEETPKEEVKPEEVAKDAEPTKEEPKPEEKAESPAPSAEEPPAAATTTEDESSAVEGGATEVETEPENESSKGALSDEDAAIKIQAAMRGKIARDEVKSMKSRKEENKESPAEPTETETETKEAPETTPEPEEESSPEEQEAAALKIQSNFRGMKARKEVEALKSDKNTDAESEKEPETEEKTDDAPTGSEPAAN